MAGVAESVPLVAMPATGEALTFLVPTLADDAVLTFGATAAALAAIGAGFTLADARGKATHERDWPHNPHSLADAVAHLATGGNAGVNAGHGGVVGLDGDERFAKFVQHDERLARAHLVYREDALPDRGKVILRCSDPRNLKSRGCYPRPGDKKPVLEVFSFGGQFIVAGIHASGALIKLWQRETVVMTAAEIDALVDAWMDAEYPEWRTHRTVSVSPLAIHQTMTSGQPTMLRTAILWWCVQPCNQLAVDTLLASCKRKGAYVSVRSSDDTPSTRLTGECDRRRTWKDYGSGETLDDYELYCRLSGLDKGAHKWQVVNEWREAHGRPPLKDTRPTVQGSRHEHFDRTQREAVTL